MVLLQVLKLLTPNETKTWADSALQYIPKYIHDEQSLNVDTITGATVTSNAIISAVEKQLKMHMVMLVNGKQMRK